MRYREIINHQFDNILEMIKSESLDSAEIDTGGGVMHNYYLMDKDVFIHVPDWNVIYRVKREITKLDEEAMQLITSLIGENADSVATLMIKNLEYQYGTWV